MIPVQACVGPSRAAGSRPLMIAIQLDLVGHDSGHLVSVLPAHHQATAAEPPGGPPLAARSNAGSTDSRGIERCLNDGDCIFPRTLILLFSLCVFTKDTSPPELPRYKTAATSPRSQAPVSHAAESRNGGNVHTALSDGRGLSQFQPLQSRANTYL